MGKKSLGEQMAEEFGTHHTCGGMITGCMACIAEWHAKKDAEIASLRADNEGYSAALETEYTRVAAANARTERAIEGLRIITVAHEGCSIAEHVAEIVAFARDLLRDLDAQEKA